MGDTMPSTFENIASQYSSQVQAAEKQEEQNQDNGLTDFVVDAADETLGYIVRSAGHSAGLPACDTAVSGTCEVASHVVGETAAQGIGEVAAQGMGEVVAQGVGEAMAQGAGEGILHFIGAILEGISV